MSLLAIVLVIISTFMHAGWNLLSKSRDPSAAFFLVASLVGALLLSPFAFLYGKTAIHLIPWQVWMFLVATGFSMAIYYISLAEAYRAGDMSVAYPIARSSAIIFVSLTSLILGRGDQLTSQCLVGIVLVAGGCYLIPIKKFNDLRPGNYANTTCILALMAAIGTAGYSMLDDEALRWLRNDPRIALGNTQVTVLYSFLEVVSVSLWLAVYVFIRPKGRLNLRRLLLTNKRNAILAGFAIHLTYLMVLISLAFVRNVSYVVGFRQLSIPLGTIFGILILKEPPDKPKLVGVAVMFVGLILVATG